MYCNFFVVVRAVSRFVLALSVVSAVGSACQAGAERVLYDVNFDGPPHAVGAEPVYGYGPFPRKTPTAGGAFFPTGSADVVPSFGGLTNRPVKLKALDGTPNEPNKLGGINLEFNLEEFLNPELANIDRYHASVDVIPSQLRTASGLGIFFDAESIHSVQFWPDGNIRIIDATGVNQIVGPYNPEQVYHVRMAFDTAASEWSASINGTPVYQGPTDENDMWMFRIAMTTGDTISPAVAYVDNIHITGDVPEPATICLAALAVGGATLVATRRFKRRSSQR
jgi:PEP-CTERM motif-containing protein